MKIVSIEWKNIGPFGNKVQKIEFDAEHPQFYQLYGRSGMGKSTVLSLPALVFYGKLRDRKIGEIANRRNKQGWLKCECQSGQHVYVIERTFSPNSLKVTMDGAEVDRARDLQGFIEDEIVGMPYYVFTNVVSLSLNDFKSFVKMTPADKRQIIDRIFSLELINKVYELVKKDSNAIGQQVNNLKTHLYMYEQQIKQSQDELARLNSMEKVDYQAKYEECYKAIAQIDGTIAANQNLIDDYNTKLADAEAQYKDIYSKCMQYDYDIRSLEEKKRLFANAKCPTCGADFTDDGHQHLKEQIDGELEKQNAESVLWKKSRDEFNAYIQSLKSGLMQLNSEKTNLTVSRNQFANEIKTLQIQESKPVGTEAIENIISTTSERRDSVQKEIDECVGKIDTYNILNLVYGADGIKKHLMDTYIPALNREIKNALSKVEFPYTFELDSNWDAHLYDMGEEIGTGTLSVGEGKRVDIAVLLAIIHMMKQKYPQLNMICLDETISSLDQETAFEVLLICKELVDELDLNIFIVSHIQLPNEYFDIRMFIEKNGGYSDIVFE